MKKKIISITLSLALTTCLLYGCGSAEATSSAETVASQASSVASSAAVSSTTASASTSETGTTSVGTPGEMSNEEIVKKAAEDGSPGTCTSQALRVCGPVTLAVQLAAVVGTPNSGNISSV